MAMIGDMKDFRDYPKRLRLHDGTTVIVRPLERHDKDLLTDFFLRLPEKDKRSYKRDVTNREVIDRWCEQLAYDHILPLIVLQDTPEGERMVADCILHTHRGGWSPHVASVRVVVAPELRDKGLGKRLYRELLSLATQMGISKVQVNVRDDNRYGQGLLGSLGFKEEAVLKKHATDVAGKRHDIIVYQKDLEDLWQEFSDLNIDLDRPIWPGEI